MNSVCYVASTLTNAVVSRAQNSIYIIPCALRVIVCPPLTLVGLAVTPLAALSFGKVKELNSFAGLSILSASILPNIFTVAMEILNPNCKITYHSKGEGTLQKKIQLKAKAILLNLTRTNNTIFKREICSRLFVAIMIPTGVVVKVVEGISAVPAVALSIVTFGCIPKVNQFAYDNLRSFGSIPVSISSGLIFTFNPHLICITNQT